MTLLKQFEYRDIKLGRSAGFIDCLNELGAQGWEIIGFSFDKQSGLAWYILKREL